MRLSISNSKIAIWIVVILASLSVFYIGARIVKLQKGYAVANEPTESWLADVARVREAIYDRQDEGKKTIWIVGGSNALFGVDSAILSEVTGFSVRNYALHASFHGDILYSQILRKVKPGDIVVSSREFSVIDVGYGSKFDYANYLRHFSRFAHLSTSKTLELYLKVPLKRWWDGLLAYVFAPAGTVPYWRQKSIAMLLDERRVGYELGSHYSHTALNDAGDLNIDAPMTRAAWVDYPETYIPSGLAPSGTGHLKYWRDQFEAAGAVFFGIMPAVIENRSREIVTPALWQKISNHRQQMADAEVPLHCSPLSSVFSAVYRLDTPYHLNAAGARLRSMELGRCLLKAIEGKEVAMEAFDPNAIAKEVAQRLREQRENFGEGGLPYQLNLRALEKLHKALKRKFAVGDYPETQSVEELAELLGVGPVPGGLEYFSDGTRFSLIGYSVAERSCPVIAANWPELILPSGIVDGDPTRCSAYGFWD